jgi:hypothetical protein
VLDRGYSGSWEWTSNTMATPRSRAARTPTSICQTAGYYGVLCMHNRATVLEGYGASDRGYADFREFIFCATRMNKTAKGYYEPLHSTLSSTFCASGAMSSK